MSNKELVFPNGEPFDLWGEHLIQFLLKGAKVRVYLVNGICLNGKVRRFDKGSVLLSSHNKEPMLINRESVATIAHDDHKVATCE
ncbi:RNA chaperone Hfq [Pseudoalteromonas sp. McH1-7]|uniref:Uncharacterized protein n=1 Tax=Pseudoalteromonas peptidolytica F12-50-A1 TaxID=1315280 RepID=A0A8I0T5B0_9GAMM|nr:MULTISPECIES: RNA chaperone Hfq [Pseudoalteromonas]MBE0347880.1 hypothetical protein [Pseudoalteromonas peptidolytica F12-50-A1]MDW7551314.1 RNA chaperone Hfq [Pseudoalteromonas peptidolytica]NLR15320.1 hypothetical protein [Pseudoalteromonas peptidolytica]NUZ11929.1 RNA chaperone Hfq [Pseudoalteromonas sp. McH1-7]RRS09119.1 hypothetical protein EAG18_08340 [Pseudoalteromonas sp. J010]